MENGKEVVDALNEFEIADKPAESIFRKNGEYTKLIIAIKNLANDKSIKLPISSLRTSNVSNFRAHLQNKGRLIGIKIGTVQKGPYLYIFQR